MAYKLSLGIVCPSARGTSPSAGSACMQVYQQQTGRCLAVHSRVPPGAHQLQPESPRETV